MELQELRDKAAIVGVGYTPQGVVPGRTTGSFMLEAAVNAMEDAGLTNKDVDGILLQPAGISLDIDHFGLATRLGLNLRYTSGSYVRGSAAGCMATDAARAVISGQANYVLCVYGENSRSGTPGAYEGGGEQATYGMFGAPMTYGMAARRGMHEFGTGSETWVHIAMNERKWANLNPRATMFAKPMSREDYFNAPWVAEPFRRFDCCLVTDSGRAFIVTTAERAKRLKQPPVYIMGMGQHHPAADFVQSPVLAGPTGAKQSGKAAFEMAGISLKDIDACEIYDCFTYTVEITMQSYGFYKPGGALDFFKDGRTAPGGEFPVNTSGGLLSEVYCQGFTPISEGVMQLRGQCGERQIKDAEIILVNGDGGGLQTHSTLILRR